MGKRLTAMVKKPETRILLFCIIWFIGGALALQLAFSSPIIEPHPIIVLLWFSISLISFNMFVQRADLENWVCACLQSEWKYIETPLSKLPSHLRFVSLFAAIPFTAFIIVLVLALVLASYCGIVLWISCDGDISKFGENINNYTSIILIFIFMAQAWIFYQQYRHMKQPFFKAPLFWILSKSNSDTDCCILLKNGGNAPIFNISYHILEVSVNDIWGYKIIKSKKISDYFLPRLGGGFEKEIFGKPTKEFKEMRLAVYLSVKTLDGHSTSLFFYKAPGDLDFRLAGSVHT